MPPGIPPGIYQSVPPRNIKSWKGWMVCPFLTEIDQAKSLGDLFRVMASVRFPVLTYALALSFHWARWAGRRA